MPGHSCWAIVSLTMATPSEDDDADLGARETRGDPVDAS
jgi:hypothetical protein